MSLGAAAGWAVSATAAFLSLCGALVHPGPSGVLDVIPAFGCQAVAYLLALSLISRVYDAGRPVGCFLAVQRVPFRYYALAALLGVAVVMPMDAIYDAMLRRYPVTSPDALTEVFRQPGLTAGKRVVVVVVVAGLGPILEECLFRGALFGALRQRYPAYVVIAWTSMLFAAAHVSWQRFVPIAIAGLALGAMRSASGSIFPPVLVHMAINGTSLVLTALESPDVPPHGPPRWWAVGSGALALLLLGLTARIARGSARPHANARRTLAV
jgi:membrane protease YdiL (CAAX protease family)